MAKEKAPGGELELLRKIEEYCQGTQSSIDPKFFFLYYSNRGRKLKNWKKVLRIWERGKGV